MRTVYEVIVPGAADGDSYFCTHEHQTIAAAIACMYDCKHEHETQRGADLCPSRGFIRTSAHVMALEKKQWRSLTPDEENLVEEASRLFRTSPA